VVYIYFFSEPQHKTMEKPSSDWMNTFEKGIRQMGKLLLVLNDWRTPTPLTRAWCVLEIYTLVACGGMLAVVLFPDAKTSFLNDLKSNSREFWGSYFQTIQEFKAESSECSRPEDKAKIHGKVRTKMGFPELNQIVYKAFEQSLMNWVLQVSQAEVMPDDCISQLMAIQNLRNSVPDEDSSDLLQRLSGFIRVSTGSRDSVNFHTSELSPILSSSSFFLPSQMKDDR